MKLFPSVVWKQMRSNDREQKLSLVQKFSLIRIFHYQSNLCKLWIKNMTLLRFFKSKISSSGQIKKTGAHIGWSPDVLQKQKPANLIPFTAVYGNLSIPDAAWDRFPFLVGLQQHFLHSFICNICLERLAPKQTQHPGNQLLRMHN